MDMLEMLLKCEDDKTVAFPMMLHKLRLKNDTL